MKRTLTDDEFEQFFQDYDGWIILTTLTKAGFPHTIPIGYFLHGDKVYIGTRDNTQKIHNIERNPKVSLLIESGDSMQNIKGAMIQGHARIIRDGQEAIDVARIAAKSRGMADADLPDQAPPGAAYIEVTPLHKISWDYGR